MTESSDLNKTEEDLAVFPDRPVERWLAPLNRFLHTEAASGVVLVTCTIIALAAANSPFAYDFEHFWETAVSLTVGAYSISGSLVHLVINDGLMTIFFFVVGLELKREIVGGELASPRQAILPVLAAIGGMIMPALVYLALTWQQTGQRGWAIPMATDIAFVVGILALFGKRVPLGLKIFLLSLAIVDDMGAVLIIAFVFTESLSWWWLAGAGAGLVAVVILNQVGVRQIIVYTMVGALVWLAFYKAGVHPTVAGVLLGLLTPTVSWIRDDVFERTLEETQRRRAKGFSSPEEELEILERLRFATRETVSPLDRLEDDLHVWVAFVIMPVFALANAGVALNMSDATDRVALAVAAGLAVGKPLGILGACLLAVKLGWANLPQGVTWKMMQAAGCLAGIGFTMALFLDTLAFPIGAYPEQQMAGKIGTLMGSFISLLLGSALMFWALSSAPKQPEEQAT